jgi:hypothetical protein
MTNQEKLQDVRTQLENWEELSLLEHFDLVLNVLPAVITGAKYRPNDQYASSREESDFQKGLLDNTDIEFNK